MSWLEHYSGDDQEVLTQILGALECGIFLLDRGSTVVWGNRWIEADSSGAEPWLGKGLGELLRDAREGGDPPTLESLIEEGPRKWIVPHASPRRAGKWLEISLSPLVGEDGEATGAIGKVEDISERLRTEEQLLDEAQRRRILVEQSRDGIVVVTEEGDVYEANQRFADMLGYSLEEVHQLKVWDWDALFGEEEIRGMIKAVDEKGDNFETRHRRKDGSVFDVEISTNGSMCGERKLIFCVCRDITERRRKEKEREQLIKRLRRASAELEGFPEILALCAFCKKIRNEGGDWSDIEDFIDEHLQRRVSHGICPKCVKEHYPEIDS